MNQTRREGRERYDKGMKLLTWWFFFLMITQMAAFLMFGFDFFLIIGVVLGDTLMTIILFNLHMKGLRQIYDRIEAMDR